MVDIQLMRHKIIYDIETYELVLILRNRFGGYVDISKSTLTATEGVFKNEYIDIIKPRSMSTFENKCDANNRILKKERYDLQNLEDEYVISSKANNDFHGLEPFELAEFRVVHSSILEALDIKKQELGGK